MSKNTQNNIEDKRPESQASVKGLLTDKKVIVTLISAVINGIFAIIVALVGAGIKSDIADVNKNIMEMNTKIEVKNNFSPNIIFNPSFLNSILLSLQNQSMDINNPVVKTPEKTSNVQSDIKDTAEEHAMPFMILFLNPDGWDTNVQLSFNENIMTISGMAFRTAGFHNPSVGKNIAGKTLVLEFSNTSNSKCKFKFEIDDRFAEIVTAGIKADEHGYIDPLERRIEYRVPTSFNGKLNFVFDKPDLNGLTIATFVK